MSRLVREGREPCDYREKQWSRQREQCVQMFEGRGTAGMVKGQQLAQIGARSGRKSK